MAVRRSTHIQVDFVYASFRAAAGRVMATFVDGCASAFSLRVWLTWPAHRPHRRPAHGGDELPIGLVFGAMLVGFALIRRSLQVA